MQADTVSVQPFHGSLLSAAYPTAPTACPCHLLSQKHCTRWQVKSNPNDLVLWWECWAGTGLCGKARLHL